MPGFKIIIMELMDFSLFNYLCKMPGYCVPEITARKFTQQIALGLLYMHKMKLAHRDLKPENILMRKVGEPEEFELKLCDFGFAREGDALKTHIGTTEYMAPEIMVNPTRGAKYGPEVDLWALGCVVYFMLCGSLHVGKLKGAQIMDLVLSKDAISLPPNKNFSDAARSFVTKLLTKMPRDRMTFEMLQTHPFLASSMHFTLFMSRNDLADGNAGVTTIHNIVLESTDILSSRAGDMQLLWSDVATAFMKKACAIPGVQNDQQLLILHDGNAMDFGSPIHFSTNNYRALEVFVFMNVTAPREVPKGFTVEVPIMDINKLEEIRAGLPAYTLEYVQREAQIYMSELTGACERYENVMEQWKSVKQVIGCIEQVCAKYVTKFVEPALTRATGAMRANRDLARRILFNVPAPVNTVRDIEELFHTEWNEFLSRMVGCTRMIDECMQERSTSIGSYKKAFAEAEASLKKYPVVITELYTSFFVIWNTMHNLFVSIRALYELSAFVESAQWVDPAEACENFMEYNHKLSKILADNPSWQPRVFMDGMGAGTGIGGSGNFIYQSSSGDKVLKEQLAAAQKELADAQKRVMELQAENAKLKSKVSALEQLYGQAESYLKDSQKKKI